MAALRYLQVSNLIFLFPLGDLVTSYAAYLPKIFCEPKLLKPLGQLVSAEYSIGNSSVYSWFVWLKICTCSRLNLPKNIILQCTVL